MAHLWSGRFDEEPDPSVFEFGVSLAFDRRLFEDDVTGSLAWAEALCRAGVLSAADAAAIADGLAAILDDGPPRSGVCSTAPDEDMHAFVERQLVERDRRGRASACTPAARATSRCRSTCAST